MNDCSCHKCVGACKTNPGWFAPGQIEAVAEHLGITLKELFDTKLGVDYWASVDPVIFVLSPAVVGNAPGVEYPFAPAGGRCVFLTEDDKCSIHPVKPMECREFSHDRPREEMNALKEKNVEDWKGHQGQIYELLGRAPVMPQPTVLDALELLRSLTRPKP